MMLSGSPRVHGNKYWVEGKAAFARLHSMLDDSEFTYQQIGSKLGLTKQCIAKLAQELGINGRQRQRERTLSRGPHVIK
jgi:hypothetical protein